MSDDIQKIIKEYSKDYCLLLEAAYGSHMMSEGGEAAIERMFSKEDLYNKKILDIGFGLGGVAFYLAEKYQSQVSGVEINPWMVEEATRRISPHLKKQVHFSEYHPEKMLPFGNDNFDIVFSKGVLTHLKDKKNLFLEIKRILKPGAVLIIDDWLSPKKDHWCDRLKQMCETEGLTLYAETENNYKNLLREVGFFDIEMRDENANYYQYNMDIVNHLIQEKQHPSNLLFTQKMLEDSMRGYQLIADSIRDNDLLIRWFRGVAQ